MKKIKPFFFKYASAGKYRQLLDYVGFTRFPGENYILVYERMYLKIQIFTVIRK